MQLDDGTVQPTCGAAGIVLFPPPGKPHEVGLFPRNVGDGIALGDGLGIPNKETIGGEVALNPEDARISCGYDGFPAPDAFDMSRAGRDANAGGLMMVGVSVCGGAATAVCGIRTRESVAWLRLAARQVVSIATQPELYPRMGWSGIPG
jgi:hypothetical protein